MFERATHRGPIFVGKSRHRDQNFRARSKISIEIENFDRDQIFLIVGPSGILDWIKRSINSSGMI